MKRFRAIHQGQGAYSFGEDPEGTLVGLKEVTGRDVRIAELELMIERLVAGAMWSTHPLLDEARALLRKSDHG